MLQLFAYETLGLKATNLHLPEFSSWIDTKFKFIAVIPQTAKCHRNQGKDSLGQGDTWESGITTVTEKEVCIPFLMQLDQSWLYLIGVLLSIHHYSTLDKEMLLSQVLETFSQLSLQGQGHWKIGSGESVTWLFRNCDVTAELLPLRYIFMWQKLYVWLYHNGNHNKTCSKCFAYIDLKKILTSILWMNLLVFTKQPYPQDQFHIIITNHEVRVMVWKVAHMTKRDLLLFC